MEFDREHILDQWKEHPMRKPRIGKVTVNIGVGTSGEKLEKARTVLEQLTGQTPINKNAKQTIRDFGIRRHEPIACMVTLREKGKIYHFLEGAFQTSYIDQTLLFRNFDKFGNFSFGIEEHIEFPGTRYDPDLGIFGMDVCVTMERPGYRINKRRRLKKKIPKNHRLTREEVWVFLEEEFDIKLVKERRRFEY